jgi:hypothetical protein
VPAPIGHFVEQHLLETQALKPLGFPKLALAQIDERES